MAVIFLKLNQVKLNQLSDEALMLKVKNGQLDVMKLLFERYHLLLYNFFFRMSMDEELSKDLVQNLFIRIIRYKKSFNPEYKFKTWMYQMAPTKLITEPRANLTFRTMIEKL